MIKYSSYEIEYLIELLASSIKQRPAPIPKKELDTVKLLEIANKQQVYNTILYNLENSNILTAEELSNWKNYSCSELKKTIIVNAEREKICAQLDDLGVNYMFLKGLEIREYYPKTLMRQMTDNDILYDQSKRDVLLKVMKKNGYYLGTAIGASDDFFKEPYCTFEFHRTLFSENDAFNKDYDPWVNASKKEDTCRYILSREDNYIYTLCHMYKHYIHGSGCGVRFLCDLYLLAHSDDVLDFDFINSKLDEFGVLEFSNTALGLAEALFDARDPDEKQQELLDVMFLGGVFGRGTDKVKKELEKHNGSKFKYILRRIFPPKKMMVGNYKSLEKRPYLLPFYYIYRLFEKMHHNGGILKDELKRLSSIKNDK